MFKHISLDFVYCVFRCTYFSGWERCGMERKKETARERERWREREQHIFINNVPYLGTLDNIYIVSLLLFLFFFSFSSSAFFLFCFFVYYFFRYSLLFSVPSEYLVAYFFPSRFMFIICSCSVFRNTHNTTSIALHIKQGVPKSEKTHGSLKLTYT